MNVCIYLIFASKLMLALLRKPKIICSPSCVDFRSKTNAVMLLDMGHIQEE
jgi:hypothetical protein